MRNAEFKKLMIKSINNKKWEDVLSRFIEVLRVNMFIVDSKGNIIVPPKKTRYGGRLIMDPSLQFDLLDNFQVNIEKFDSHGQYFEIINKYRLNCFAIPIHPKKDQIVAYLIIGPLIVNKRHENSKYEEMAKNLNTNFHNLLNEIDELRIVSNLMVNSILELLSEVVKNSLELSLKEKVLKHKELEQGSGKQDKTWIKKESKNTVSFDNLLRTILDIALKMTDTEAGSIMVLDNNKSYLTLKVTRGYDSKKILGERLKIGDGIAGLAAKENESFFINGQKCDNRISHLLKRPDIKQSFIMPLISDNKVIGVLNLHTKKIRSKIQDNIDNLKYLSTLLPSV